MLFHAAPSQPENNRLTVTMLFAGRSLSRRQVPRGPATATVATATTSDVQQPSPTSLSAALVRAQVPPCVDATGHPLQCHAPLALPSLPPSPPLTHSPKPSRVDLYDRPPPFLPLPCLVHRAHKRGDAQLQPLRADHLHLHHHKRVGRRVRRHPLPRRIRRRAVGAQRRAGGPNTTASPDRRYCSRVSGKWKHSSVAAVAASSAALADRPSLIKV